EDCSLTVIGPNQEDTRYVRWLESQARGRRVEFTGQIVDEEKRAIIASSDALVASSHHKLYDGRVIPQPELLGLVIFEALAHNTMPITSDIPSFREVMGNLGLSDFTYQEDHSDSLREVIAHYRAAARSEIADRLQEARRRMESQYLWDNLWDRITRQIPLWRP